MSRDADRQKLFTRRALVLAGGKVLVLSVLAGRLYYLQVVEAERYATLAEENRINVLLLPPPRGRITDRLGRPLAVNRQNYRVIVVAEQTSDVSATLDRLAAVVPLADSDRKRVLGEITRKRRFVPVTVRENLAWEDIARVEVNAPDLPGVAVEEGQTRHYPYGEMLAHVLGYLAPVAEQDLTGDDPLLELPGFRIGKDGIEKVYDRALRGMSGASEVEVNAVGRMVRELERKEGQPGIDLALTLDLDLQRLATSRLTDQSGAIVLMDIHSGEVLALASMPGFDPEAFNRGLTPDEWRDLTANPKGPLTNKAIAGQYAPGSTFKPMVALAALEEGAIRPETRIFCPGKIALGNAEFHCWKKGGHGTLGLREAIAQSCDVYFYETARRIGVDKISEMARRFGLGDTLGIDLPHERSGCLPTRGWKAKRFGIPWQKGETLVAGIGQGYVLATPLQLAVMAARIADGGLAVVPRLARDPKMFDEVHPRAGNPRADLRVNPAHLNVVRDGMVSVVNGPRGTAKASAILEPGLQMAGKTGTSQVRRISKAEREQGVIKNEKLPWERRDHALFIGYAPVHASRYAVAVVIEHGGGGSKAAAPVARDILLAAQKLDAARVAANPADPLGPTPEHLNPHG